MCLTLHHHHHSQNYQNYFFYFLYLFFLSRSIFRDHSKHFSPAGGALLPFQRFFIVGHIRCSASLMLASVSNAESQLTLSSFSSLRNQIPKFSLTSCFTDDTSSRAEGRQKIIFTTNLYSNIFIKSNHEISSSFILFFSKLPFWCHFIHQISPQIHNIESKKNLPAFILDENTSIHTFHHFNPSGAKERKKKFLQTCHLVLSSPLATAVKTVALWKTSTLQFDSLSN